MRINSRKSLFIAIVFVTMLIGPIGLCKVKLPAFFQDNMVLQHGKIVPVWGWASPGEMVSVSFADQRLKTKADNQGNWMVKFKPLAVSAKGRDLVVSGNNKIILKNVLVGDVWLCAGQSNMAMSCFYCLDEKGKQDAAKYPMFRQCTINALDSDIPLKDTVCKRKSWMVCNPKNVQFFTATGYFFARKVYSEMKIPIGLIMPAWVGSIIESWIAPDAYRQYPALKTFSDKLEKIDVTSDDGNNAHMEMIKKVKKWLVNAEKAVAAKRYPAPIPETPSLGKTEAAPGKIFNSRIIPLVPLAIKGLLWYQGESNCHPLNQADYYEKMHALITGWRKLWNDNFPFYYVQLPGFGNAAIAPDETGTSNKRSWKWIREAQLKCFDIPNSGMAISIDTTKKVPDLHPENKQDIGYRLGLLALAETYGNKGLVYSGPIYNRMAVEGDKIRIYFNHIGSGLMVGKKNWRDPVVEAPNETLKQFTIAGKDKEWHWADAVIDGNSVVVSSPKVKDPLAVRYAFSTNPYGCNLYNKEGLPASPFRTDNW